jgi:HEAT repeat protein
VAPLRGALASPDPRLRMASIRGLGRVATPSARRALEEAAASHSDADTRRRARAEAVQLRGAQ